ncbi:MAG TPA: UrcA family protein [Alphaproteobacteria bacterium]|nr:UrcA family protein [Alphaproteobacteria bacterium]
MRLIVPALRHACTAFAAAGALVGALATLTGSAAAQTTDPNTTQEMTIYTPGVHQRTVGRSTIGAPIEELSLSLGVDYSDLDLSRGGDVEMLDSRIRQAALTACDQLERDYPEVLYPSYQSSDASCAAEATEQGMAQARVAVAQRSAPPLDR